MLPFGWSCFVVNLDRSPQRLANMSEQLADACIPFERFAAVDGRAIDLDSTPHFKRAAYEARHGKAAAAGELGCLLSHVGVWTRFLESGRDFCLVLEDDAIVDPALSSALAGLGRQAEQWDVALLYGNHSGLPRTLSTLDARHKLVGFLGRQTGTVAYAINRRAARAYLDNLLPMTLPIDIDYDRAWDFGIKFRGVLPFPVATGAYPSDIGETGRKFPWYRRLGTYARRGVNELRRYRHYALRDPIWLAALRHGYRARVKGLAAPIGSLATDP